MTIEELMGYNHFYPRPPRGGRRPFGHQAGSRSAISTHALREEGDVFIGFCRYGHGISTHALREEGDAGQ